MRIVVLHGKEAFLRSLRTADLRAALEAAHGAIEQARFDGASAQAADVLDECRSFGLMQQHKLVIVDDADEFVKEGTRPLLERYAEAPAEHATLVLRADTWRPGKLDKLVEKVGAVVKCEPIGREQAIKWAVGRAAKRWQATLDPAAAELLVERLGADLGRIDSELAKLGAASAGPGGAIGVELVRELVGLTREDEVWPLQGVLVRGDAEAALQGLTQLVQVSRQDPYFLSFVFIDLARKLHTTARLLRAGANPWQAAGKAKIWGEAKDAIVDAARRADPDALADLLDDAVESDARCKSGLADPMRSLEALAVRFASL